MSSTSGYNAFEHLWRSTNPSRDKARLMAMFTVYLDESYGKANAYAVAGYVATVSQWEAWERDWNELILLKEGVSTLHKRELEHLWGDFKKWRTLPEQEQKSKKRRVNERACGIILCRVNAGFAAAITKSDFDEVDKGGWAEYIGKSYYACGVLACMRLVAGWADEFSRNEPIDYVFESGAEGADEVSKLLHKFEKDDEVRAKFRLNTWSFASKKDRVIKGVSYPRVPQLDAADFLAYEMYRHMDNQVVNGIKLDKRGNVIPNREALRRLLQRDKSEYANLPERKMPTPHYALFLNKEKLSNLISLLDTEFNEPV